MKQLPKELTKYHRMLKLKIELHVVVNKMTLDGIGKHRMAEIQSFMTGKPMVILMKLFSADKYGIFDEIGTYFEYL